MLVLLPQYNRHTSPVKASVLLVENCTLETYSFPVATGCVTTALHEVRQTTYRLRLLQSPRRQVSACGFAETTWESEAVGATKRID